MITRLNIDNYRCFSDCEIKFGRMNLLLGGNGSGKTSVFDVLYSLQRLITGDCEVGEAFPRSKLTRWRDERVQRFGVSVQIDGEEYRYELSVEHALDGREPPQIMYEKLSRGDQGLLEVNRGIFLVSGESSFYPGYSDEVILVESRSVLSMLSHRSELTDLIRFREAVRHWRLVQIVPPIISQYSQKPTIALDRKANNFAQWMEYLENTQPGVLSRVSSELEPVWPGFECFELIPHGDGKRLRVRSQVEGRPVTLDFESISDGQKSLIVLYTLLEHARQSGTMLCVDEPDNFLALREITPWLSELEELVEEGNGQAILISHHPEIVNGLAVSHGIWFHRPNMGSVKVGRYPVVDGLTAAETMVRGWECNE